MTRPELCFDLTLPRDEAQRQLAQVFDAAGVDTAALDARLVLCTALGIDHAALIRDAHLPIGATAERIAALARRRSSREPMSRILGQREFWGLDFAIGPAVLDPRPETEVVVETVVSALAARRAEPLRILDLGIGSGAILGALLMQLPKAFGVGVDLSEAACRIAKRNLKTLGLAPRASVLCSDWTKPLSGAFDAIVSNPPYVARVDLATLAPEVRDHDPRPALDGGRDGLAAHRAIVPSLAALLAPSAIVALELGAGQARDVAQMLARAGFAVIGTHRDLSGHERVITACPAI
jgi:release factor glutamine methyltransferase